MTTNNSESFNNTLKGVRFLPVSTIVKVTLEKLALQFADRRTKGLMMRQAGLQWPRKILDEMLKMDTYKFRAKVKRHDDVQGVYTIAIEGVVTPSERPKFETINMHAGYCSCGQWAVDGLPCMHAHAPSHYVGRVPDGMVPEKYSLENYIKCYEGTIMPLFSDEYWPLIPYTVLPPQGVPQRRGRRPSRRIPNEMDLQGRRCGICRSANHDVRKCIHVSSDGRE
ncbi:PREDICTED: uncharacterized protein LOC109194028 [Ipomoea nil]|uniref:uncharacterized protein LOC109194028 n=1 Tax=Ipomoea nil TaxID=35883 RepID=UPI000900A5C5|nr:PREDICTED: uncharacterized protein LOC109194028 [Ipomoea nil]